MSEIPVFSSPEEDDAAEAGIDEMRSGEVRSELATNNYTSLLLSEQENEMRAELMKNRSTQTKLRRRREALLRRLRQLESD